MPPSVLQNVAATSRTRFNWLRFLTVHKANQGIWAVLDQAVVSGANFLTTVLVGRNCGEEGLGVYTLGFAWVVLILGMQQSLIATPYTVYAQKLVGDARRAYAGSALVHLGLLAIGTFVILICLGLISHSLLQSLHLEKFPFILSGIIPFVLLRDFLRRVAFAELRMDTALAVDMCASLVQLGLIVGLAVTGKLTVLGAYIAMGVGCGIAGSTCLLAQSRRFVIRREDVIDSLKSNWTLGRWVFADQLISIVHLYILHWLLAILYSPAAAGAFAACSAVIMLSNPFLTAMSNVMAPRFAIAEAHEARMAIRQMYWKCSLPTIGFMAVFCILVCAGGDRLVAIMYGDEEFEGLGIVVAILAVRHLISSLCLAAHHGLVVRERARLSLFSSVAGLATTSTLALILIDRAGIEGGAVAWLIGGVIETAVILSYFFLETRPSVSV